MNELTADVIVELFRQYQILTFIRSVSIPFLMVSSVMFVITWVCFITQFNEGVHDFSFGFLLFSLIVTLFWLGSLLVLLYSKYQIECVLKVEVMRYLAQPSLDLLDVVGKEMLEMWRLLKEALVVK